MERGGGAGGMRMLSDTGIEENTLAILDSSGIKDSNDEIDDRLAFLEAVRAASLSPDAGVAPTSKMCQAIFQILKDGKNLELCVVSYQLLLDIDKRFPRLITPSVDVSNSSSSKVDSELVMAKEAWSPFVSGVDISASAGGTTGGLIDSYEFRQLIETQVEDAERPIIGVKSLRNMLLFHYLVNVLEGDFLPRRESYRETMHWPTVKDSQLNLLLGSRRINFKSLIKDCVTLLSTLQNLSIEDSHGLSGSEEAKPSDSCERDAAVFMASLEMGKCTCLAIRKFLLMTMELDALKNAADMHHQTTRGDSVRTPAFEIILDELTYDADTLFQFIQAFDEPKWKLELAVQYLRKYIAKPSVRTRRSKDSTENGTLVGLLNTLSNPASAKTVIRKIRSHEVLEFLLAHAFQASLSLSIGQQLSEGTDNSSEILRGSSKEEVCKGMISAFQGLKKADEHVGSLPIAKEALFTAATLLSLKCVTDCEANTAGFDCE